MHSLLVIAATSLLALSAAAYPTKITLNCRSSPSTSSTIVRTYPKGYDIKISCQTTGTKVSTPITVPQDFLSGGEYEYLQLLTKMPRLKPPTSGTKRSTAATCRTTTSPPVTPASSPPNAAVALAEEAPAGHQTSTRPP
jgi:hypothetical protein